jgi:predicted HAD superfamily Cof-like phosphohydrolase
MSQFQDDIAKFNAMYKLPVSPIPSLDNLGVDAVTRLEAFQDILSEELLEIVPIIEAIKAGEASIDVLTSLADLLGDIQVYCASEMAKFGIPLDLTLGAIMQSNFSKMGADGKPIYDERGKLQKGPGYWKPEPMIKSILEREGK